MAYDPNIRSNLAKLIPGIFPSFGVQLKAKMLLFNPKPDMVLGNLPTCGAFELNPLRVELK